MLQIGNFYDINARNSPTATQMALHHIDRKKSQSEVDMVETFDKPGLATQVQRPRLQSRGKTFINRSVCGGANEVFNAVMNQKEVLKKRRLEAAVSPNLRKLNYDSEVSIPGQRPLRTETGLSIIDQIEAHDTASRISTGRPNVNIK